VLTKGKLRRWLLLERVDPCGEWGFFVINSTVYSP
jgi:hypothetical protein